MIKNGHILKEFEDSFARKEGYIPPDKAQKIFSALWQEAVSLGKIPFPDPMEGIEVDIKMAGILNSCAAPEDVVIHKIVAGRPRDIEDVRGIMLKMPDIDIAYIRQWLEDFSNALGDDEIKKRLESVINTLR